MGAREVDGDATGGTEEAPPGFLPTRAFLKRPSGGAERSCNSGMAITSANLSTVWTE